VVSAEPIWKMKLPPGLLVKSSSSAPVSCAELAKL
jgi:hypothetical protein